MYVITLLFLMKIYNHIFIYIFYLLSIHLVHSQESQILIKEMHVEGSDTLLYTDIPSVEIISFKDPKERNRYYKLRRRVIKVYPYAIYTKNKLETIESDLNQINRKRKKKKYIKEVTKFLKEELTHELRNLSRKEGNILVKLIYRETSMSSYKILRQYRGRLNAFFWQNISRIYENDLKQEYDPVNNREDMLIEHIIINAKIQGKL